jgi:hypothetical protein
MLACIVCNTPNATWRELDGWNRHYDCPRCGKFMLSKAAQSDLTGYFEQPGNRRSLMSHALRKMQSQKSTWIIQHDDLPSFWEGQRLPSPREQTNALIRWIGDNQTDQFTAAETMVSTLSANIGLPISDSSDLQGFS